MSFREAMKMVVAVSVGTGVLLGVALPLMNRNAGPQANTELSAQSRPEDETALKILKLPSLWGDICERVADAEILERIAGTASANNHPAYVIGVRFVCVDSVAGNKTFVQYVGWMANSDTGQVECIHHNQDRGQVIAGGWWACGGNFRVK